MTVVSNGGYISLGNCAKPVPKPFFFLDKPTTRRGFTFMTIYWFRQYLAGITQAHNARLIRVSLVNLYTYIYLNLGLPYLSVISLEQDDDENTGPK